MIQEYLLLDNAQKDAIKSYEYEGIKAKLFSANNDKCWIAHFNVNGENENNAKMLSDVDQYVRRHFSVNILEDGCSAYFNKRLYPLVSRFEYMLRKLLYLTSAVNKDDKSTANVTDLESQDFGQIFTLLFIDNEFMRNIKDEVKGRNRDDFTKAEIIALIECTEENTLWDVLLGKDVVPTLRNSFHDVRLYRNNVMHSHSINWGKYKEIKKLYSTINSEIDIALHQIEVTEIKPRFNITLNEALRAQAKLLGASDFFQSLVEEMCQLSNLSLTNSEFSLESISMFHEMQKQYEWYSEITEKYQPSQFIRALNDQIKENLALKIEILPALKKIREKLNLPKIGTFPELLRLQKNLDEFLHTQDGDSSKIEYSEDSNDENDKPQDND